MTLIIMYALTAYLGGGSFWQQSLLQSLGVKPYEWIPTSAYKLAWNEWWMIYGGLVLVFNTYQRYAILQVYTASQINLVSSTVNVMQARRERKQDPLRPLFGLLPFLYAWILIPTYLALRPQILIYHLVPFTFFVGLINAYSVGQIITAHLTKSRFPYQNVLLTPLFFGVVDSIGPWLQNEFGYGWPSALGPAYQVPFVFMCLGLGIGIYGSFVFDVIVAICDYLDIWCLQIKHPYVEPAKGKKRA